MRGRVHALSSLGAVDGPGLRYVVFLQGCPLRCPYCHNPDSWDFSGGEEMDSDALIKKIARARAYVDGVTLTGGEPLAQPDFALALLSGLKREGFHTAVDTSGAIIPDNMDALCENTDLFLVDIKDDDSGFLTALDARGKDAWARRVVVPGIDDRPGEIKRIAALLRPHKCVQKLELLPFRKLCTSKYERLGIPFPLAHVDEATPALIEKLSREAEEERKHQRD